MQIINGDDIKIAIEKAFRELVLEAKYKSITISDICERAHISRNTFYINYPNKESIVASIFRHDAIKPLEDTHALFSRDEVKGIAEISFILTAKMYQRIQDNGGFYIALVRPMKGHDDTFIRIVTNIIYEFDLDLFASTNFSGTVQEADYAAYFFASAQAMIMQKWISAGFDMPVKELAQLYSELVGPFWESRAH